VKFLHSDQPGSVRKLDPHEITRCRCEWSTARSPSPPALGGALALNRLATTLRSWRRYPAPELIRLYHQRWEIETAYLELKSTLLGGRVLRARTPAGVAQEVYAPLTCYQVLRIAITDAIEAAGDIDPGRGSFTVALNAARDLLTQAANVIVGTVIDLTGAIGRRVLGTFCPTGACASAPGS